MIIKTKKRYVEGEDDSKLVIELVDGVLTIKFESKTENDVVVMEKSVVLQEIYKPITTYTVFSSLDDKQLLDPIKMKLSKDFNYEYFRRVHGYGEVVLNIYFNNSIDEVLIIARHPVDGECDIHSHIRDMDVILDTYPEYQKLHKRRIKKEQLLADLDCNDSLSGLEAQVDYLTLLVKEVILTDTDIREKLIKKYPNIQKFFEVCDSENVLLVKPEEKLFSEISMQKEFIRSKQSEYYEVINK